MSISKALHHLSAIFAGLNIYHVFGHAKIWTSKDILRGFMLISLLSVGIFSNPFLLEIGLISSYRMPPPLLSYLIRMLRN